MEKINMMCIDDQRGVLMALRKDLGFFKDACTIIVCESADEAAEVLDEIDTAGEHLAVIICDHLMPGKSGVDFLIELNGDARFPKTKKLLLTGLATHQDTIVAINEAQIDRYIEKPWDKESLIQTVKVLLTLYLLQSGSDYKLYLKILDQQTLYRELRNHGYGSS